MKDTPMTCYSPGNEIFTISNEDLPRGEPALSSHAVAVVISAAVDNDIENHALHVGDILLYFA